MQKKLSIICPVFNKERYLFQTINSVLNQTRGDWELLLIDDGSTDNSFSIASEFQTKDKRIKLHKRADFKSNKGGSVCRNIGIDKATGNYIMFLDADDCLASFCVEQRLDFIVKKGKDLDFIVFKTTNFIGRLPHLEKKEVQNSKLQKGQEAYFIRQFCKKVLPWNITACLWKKEAFDKNEGFIEAFTRLQDPELHLRSLLLGLKCGHMKNGQADALIRLDEDRRAVSHLNLLTTYVDNTKQFLRVFSALIEQQGYKNLTPLLTGYIIRVEQYAVYWSNVDYDKQEDYKKELARLYDDEVVQNILTPIAKLFIKTLWSLSRYRVLFRLKYHSILTQVYLKIIL